MSSTTKAPLAVQPNKPIEILPSPSSQLFSNLHPILLLGTLLFNFKTLVNDPVNTLLGLAPTIALLQAFYCILCLPPPGSQAKGSAKKKGAKASSDLAGRIVVCHHLPPSKPKDSHG